MSIYNVLFDILKFNNILKTNINKTSPSVFMSSEDIEAIQVWLKSNETNQDLATLPPALEQRYKAILETLSSTHQIDDKGNPYLMLAALNNYARIIEAVLAAFPDVDFFKHQNKAKEKLLTLTAQRGSMECLKALLAHPSMKKGIDIKENNELDALMWAAAEGRSQAVQLLLDHGASLNNGEGDTDRPTALFYAVNQGDLACVRILLNAGAKKINFKNKTLVQQAGVKKHHKLLPLLKDLTLEQQSKIQKMTDEINILINFLEHREVDAVTFSHALKNSKTKLQEWLTYAPAERFETLATAQEGYTTCINAVIDRFKSGIIEKNKNNMFAVAIKFKYTRVALAMIEKAPITLLDTVIDDTYLPHHFAAIIDLPVVLKAMLDKKPDLINTRNSKENYTVLMYSAAFGHSACVKLLLDRGMQVDGDDLNNAPDHLTPLMLAAKAPSLEVVKMLVEHKADISRIYLGKTAEQHTQTYVNDRPGCASVIAYLKSKREALVPQPQAAMPSPSHTDPAVKLRALLNQANELKNQLDEQTGLIAEQMALLSTEEADLEKQKNSIEKTQGLVHDCQRQVDAYNKEIEQIKQQLADLEMKKNTCLEKMNTANNNLSVHQEEKKKIETKVGTLNTSIQEKITHKNELEQHLNDNTNQRATCLDDIVKLVDESRRFDMRSGTQQGLRLTMGDAGTNSVLSNNNNSGQQKRSSEEANNSNIGNGNTKKRK